MHYVGTAYSYTMLLATVPVRYTVQPVLGATQSAETSLTPPSRLLSLLIPVALPSRMSVGWMQCAKVYSTLGTWRDRGSRPGSEMFAPTPWIFYFSQGWAGGIFKLEGNGGREALTIQFGLK